MPRKDGTGPNGLGGCRGINPQPENSAGKNSNGGRGIGSQYLDEPSRGQGRQYRNGASKDGSSK